MYRAHRALMVVAMVVVIGGMQRAVAQSACRPADSKSAALIEWLGAYTSATTGDYLGARTFLKLPFVPANLLSLVTDANVCRKAKTTYEAVANASGGTGLTGQLWVIKVGTAFAVVDPGYHRAPVAGWWELVTMDPRFKKLSQTSTKGIPSEPLPTRGGRHGRHCPPAARALRAARPCQS